MSKIQSLCTAFLMTLLLQNSFSMEAVTELNDYASSRAIQQETLKVGLFSTLPLEMNANIVKLLPLENCLTLRHTAKFFSQFISFIQVPSKTENGLEEVLERLNPHTVSIIFSSNTFSEMRIMPKIRALPFLNLITFINPIKSIAFRFNINFNCPAIPLCNIDSLQILKKDCEIAVPTKQVESLLKEIFSSEKIIKEIIFEKNPSSNAGFFQILYESQSTNDVNLIKVINSTGCYNIEFSLQKDSSFMLFILYDAITNLRYPPFDTQGIRIAMGVQMVLKNIADITFKNTSHDTMIVGSPSYSETHNATIIAGMRPCTLIFPFDDNKKD